MANGSLLACTHGWEGTAMLGYHQVSPGSLNNVTSLTMFMLNVRGAFIRFRDTIHRIFIFEAITYLLNFSESPAYCL